METSANHSLRENTWIVGLGNSGLKIVQQLHTMPEAGWMQLLAIDTDREALSACTVPNRIAAGFEWTEGCGCGGDPTKGERTFSRHRQEIANILAKARLVLVAGGLGGGTVSGGAPVITSIARGLKIPCLHVLTMPFMFEGMGKRRVAEDGLKELMIAADAVLPLPNDLLFSSRPNDEPCSVSFQEIDEEMARTVLGLAEMLRGESLIPVDVSDLKNLLNKRKTECCIGVGKATGADGVNRCSVAVDRMLASPLLGGIGQIGKADALIVCISGGDLTIGEMKRTLETIAGFAGETTRVVTGANIEPLCGDLVQVTVIAVHYDEHEELFRQQAPSHFQRKVESRRAAPVRDEGIPVQGELPLRENSRGIFANTPSSLWKNNEDLDVPTTVRREITIDRGT